jgi:hypothetical protein
MMLTKSMNHVPVLPMAMFLALACVCQSMASVPAGRTRASKALSHSLELQRAKDANQPGQNPLDQDLDSLFAKIKTEFDKMAASPVLKSPGLKAVNGFFWKSLKSHEPWHSLARTDKKGAVINEVIRIEGVSKEKRSVSGEPWFAQVSKTMKEHTNLVKVEKTGRYYLVWAAPLVAKVKGTDVFQGAVVLQIDLWDCFDRFSNKSTTPFLVRILDRVVLYEHLWKDTIKHVEKHITVPGIDKITVRYATIENKAAAVAAADSAALEQARLDSMRLDSIRIKTAGDLAAKADAERKARSHNAIIIAVLAIGLLIIIVVLVLLVKNRRRTGGTSTDERKDRFDL